MPLNNLNKNQNQEHKYKSVFILDVEKKTSLDCSSSLSQYKLQARGRGSVRWLTPLRVGDQDFSRNTYTKTNEAIYNNTSLIKDSRCPSSKDFDHYNTID